MTISEYPSFHITAYPLQRLSKLTLDIRWDRSQAVHGEPFTFTSTPKNI